VARRKKSSDSFDARVRKEIQKIKQAAKKQDDLEREQRKTERREERLRRITYTTEKQWKVQYGQADADQKNFELEEWINELESILGHALRVNDKIPFDSLLDHAQYRAKPIPRSLTEKRIAPTVDAFLAKVEPRTLVEKVTWNKRRYERDLLTAEEEFQETLREYQAVEDERLRERDEHLAKEAAAREEFERGVAQHNQAVDEFKAKYKRGDIDAIILYNTLVLERSRYPDRFPQVFRLAYSSESKELVVEYELPPVDIVPQEAEFRYIASRETIDFKQRKPAEIKKLYQDVVSAVTLRTIHEIFEADQGAAIDVVVFNGYVQSIDPANGMPVRPFLISVRATKKAFGQIFLPQVDKLTCLRNLGAQVSPHPQALQPVKPIIEFDMVDKRFIEQSDVLADLESRPNLMDLNPYEFEALVGNLFKKMGLETRLTRSSRDGGVDAVAFDMRPVLGGKIVIQAKRYKNTVGISAVRDLYGTMLNEGANKGIIVSTSGYGPDAYDFAKDKPIEMIDGGGLLYLLEQVGIKARIVMPLEEQQ